MKFLRVTYSVLIVAGLHACSGVVKTAAPSPDQKEKNHPKFGKSMVRLPTDHQAHSSSKTEWWYFSGHLQAPDGGQYHYAFCLFRRTPLLFFAHISITDQMGREFFFERKFYPVTSVRLQKQPLKISYGATQEILGSREDQFTINAHCKDMEFELNLDNQKPALLNNGTGLVQMEGAQSYYYSYTNMKTKGVLRLKGKEILVAGDSWMDHQWGDFFVLQKRWDWFALRMDDGTAYNLFSFRNRKNKTLWQSATILDSSNRVTVSKEFYLSRTRWWENPVTSRNYVTKWEIILPATSDTFIVSAIHENQEIYAKKRMDPLPSYWEGACTVIRKSANGQVVYGKGFSEHFPYKKSEESVIVNEQAFHK